MNIFFCNNCLNSGQPINQPKRTITTRTGKIIELSIAEVENGFIAFLSNDTNPSKCPCCNRDIKELSLTIEEWNILKQISTDSKFILEMDNLKQTNIIDFNLRLSQFKQSIPESKPQKSATPTPQSNIPKCPTCGSTDIKKISGARRWIGTGLFGLASSDLGKSMQCGNCGYKW